MAQKKIVKTKGQKVLLRIHTVFCGASHNLSKRLCFGKQNGYQTNALKCSQKAFLNLFKRTNVLEKGNKNIQFVKSANKNTFFNSAIC